MHYFLSSAVAIPLQTEWESPGVILLQLIIVFFLVLLNGFFVAAEFAIVKARGSQLDELVARGEKRAVLARHVTAHLDAYLSATQLGITLASLALGWVGEPFLAHMLHPLFVLAGITSEAVITSVSLTIAFTILTFLHIVLGELAPKSLAIRKSVQTTLWVSWPLSLFYTLFKPAIVFLNGTANLILRHVFHIAPVAEGELAHSEEELRLILAESREAKALSSRGSDISMRAMRLRNRRVREVITPRREVVFLDLDAPFEVNLRRAKHSRHTRFPLCREHLDETVGVIHIKEMIPLEGEPAPDLHAIKRELFSVPEMMSLETLLELFLSKHAHLAMVVDEFGGAIGIITLDNVIEELVGEIQDEFDFVQTPIERISPDEFTIKGRLSLNEVHELTTLHLYSTDSSTLGGYITEKLGHLPQTGESVRIDDYLATVMKMEGRRVKLIHFQRLPSEPGDASSHEGNSG
ncbi:MAG: hemolysin family protein [Verrucomicrobiota bacterium]